MASTSSQSCKRCECAHKLVSFLFDQTECKKCEREMVPKRPVMPRDIFDAALKGDNNVLIERLGLQTKEQTKIQIDGDSDHEISVHKGSSIRFRTHTPAQGTSHFATQSNVTIKDSHSALESQTVRSELKSATRSGDTVLHILVTKMHNELALMVFARDTSLLKTQNKILETPLHCAAKVGNQEVILKFIHIEPAVVKDALQETNEKGDTALHIAARYDFVDICENLMVFDSELAYNVNKEMFSPFHIAIDEENDPLAKKMLSIDPILACTEFTDGMFPVHLAACKNNLSMVLYLMKIFPDYTELVDSRGRNLFHFAAEVADNVEFFRLLSIHGGDMTTRMNNATDYEGNTPLHIAAMKGHGRIMRFIWKNMTNCYAENVINKRGLIPYEVSKKQLKENSNEDLTRIQSRIDAHEWAHRFNFSEDWFVDIMVPTSLENKWERTQVIGLGSVLITTVTFAAAFTIPGGYNQDYGTPILERRYMFWAFMIANALAFIQGFLSLCALLMNAVPGIPMDTFLFATIVFLFAASSMAVAFGLGLYVTLAPVCLPIAITLLVVTLFIGSPILVSALILPGERNFTIFTKFLYKKSSVLAIYAMSILFIFCLALLSP